MSDNLTPENLNSKTASQRHQEMAPPTIDALRSVVGGFVCVKYDPRTISNAPWHSDNRLNDLAMDVGYSVGMSDDLPDEMAILIRPHFVPELFEDDEEFLGGGEIVIPYTPIQFIKPLVALNERAENDERL
jgi:hypothetical protein